MNDYMSSTHVPINPEAQKAYEEFLLDTKKSKKEKWQKCRGQCMFETLDDGSHKCQLCGRKLNANASSDYGGIKEDDRDVLDELNSHIETEVDIQFEVDGDVLDEIIDEGVIND